MYMSSLFLRDDQALDLDFLRQLLPGFANLLWGLLSLIWSFLSTSWIDELTIIEFPTGLYVLGLEIESITPFFVLFSIFNGVWLGLSLLSSLKYDPFLSSYTFTTLDRLSSSSPTFSTSGDARFGSSDVRIGSFSGDYRLVTVILGIDYCWYGCLCCSYESSRSPIPAANGLLWKG